MLVIRSPNFVCKEISFAGIPGSVKNCIVGAAYEGAATVRLILAIRVTPLPVAVMETMYVPAAVPAAGVTVKVPEVVEELRFKFAGLTVKPPDAEVATETTDTPPARPEIDTVADWPVVEPEAKLIDAGLTDRVKLGAAAAIATLMVAVRVVVPLVAVTVTEYEPAAAPAAGVMLTVPDVVDWLKDKEVGLTVTGAEPADTVTETDPGLPTMLVREIEACCAVVEPEAKLRLAVALIWKSVAAAATVTVKAATCVPPTEAVNVITRCAVPTGTLTVKSALEAEPAKEVKEAIKGSETDVPVPAHWIEVPAATP